MAVIRTGKSKPETTRHYGNNRLCRLLACVSCPVCNVRTVRLNILMRIMLVLTAILMSH